MACSGGSAAQTRIRRHAFVGAVTDDNLGKRTMFETGAGGSQGPRAAVRSVKGRISYPRKVPRPADCIRTAATLAQTAAPSAKVKSEIHMASQPLALPGPDLAGLEPADNADARKPVPMNFYR
jgi:hypothetical protein